MRTQLDIPACLRAFTPLALLALLCLPASATTHPDSGRMDDFGLTLAMQDGGVVAEKVDVDGPAHRAGMRTGDRLLKIDGVNPEGSTLEQVVARLRTSRGDAVNLKVRRRSGGSQELRLKRPQNTASVSPALRGITAPSLASLAGDQVPGPQSSGRPEVIQRAAVTIGDEMLDFTLPRLGGGEVTLSAYKGKPILVDFWATWCGPCRAEAPGLAAIHRRFGEDIQIIGISLDYAPAQAIQYAMDEGLTYPQAISEGWEDPVVQAYGIQRTGIPFNVLYGPDGRIAAMDLHGEPLAQALELLLRKE